MIDDRLRELIREIVHEAIAEAVAELGTNGVETDSVVFADRLLTETRVAAIARDGAKRLHIGKRVAITPLARDKARSLGLRIERMDS